MDTIIKSKNNKKIHWKYISPIILILGLIIYVNLFKKKTLNIEKDKVSIKKIEFGYFEDFLTFQATVEPSNAILINVVENGAVTEIFAANGDSVQKNQALVKLYNPSTELNYVSQETSITEQINNMEKAKLDLRNQELNLEKDLISIEHDYNNAKNQFDLHKKLYEQDILSFNEWNNTQELFRFQVERKKNIQESIQKEKQTNQIQIRQINQSIAFMRKSRDILTKNKQNFLILAPASGRLSSFEPIVGKNYNQGESIGKIDKMDGYKLVATVDEFYLERIQIGQKGSITHQGKEISVIVSKIIPEIKNGVFKVELQFVLSDNLNLRTGLTFGVKLTLSEKQKTILLPKGSFYNETKGDWIFVLNGNTANRRNIILGRENPLFYEVKSGLNEGEMVITSNYTDYTNTDKLLLK